MVTSRYIWLMVLVVDLQCFELRVCVIAARSRYTVKNEKEWIIHFSNLLQMSCSVRLVFFFFSCEYVEVDDVFLVSRKSLEVEMDILWFVSNCGISPKWVSSMRWEGRFERFLLQKRGFFGNEMPVKNSFWKNTTFHH